MSHLFTISVPPTTIDMMAVQRADQILEKYDKLFMGTESISTVHKFKWVIEQFPKIDDEFRTFLKLQIGCNFEIVDWTWSK